ncbi:IS66 family insertion sequence element accessory protein TnpA, partial [Puniceicoccus vermicola]
SRGRKVLSDGERERLLEAYEGCGLTQKEFCRREGVNYHTFVSWLGQRRKSRDRNGPSHRSDFVEMVVPFGSASESGFELDLGGGLVVRTGDEDALWRLIERIRG